MGFKLQISLNKMQFFELFLESNSSNFSNHLIYEKPFDFHICGFKLQTFENIPQRLFTQVFLLRQQVKLERHREACLVSMEWSI